MKWIHLYFMEQAMLKGYLDCYASVQFVNRAYQTINELDRVVNFI